MRIVDVRAIPLIRSLRKTFRGGTYEITSRNTLVTEIWTDTGIVGRTFGGDENKRQEDVVRVIDKYFKPRLIGQDPFDVEKLWDEMFALEIDLGNRSVHVLDLNNHGAQMQALAAVDIALWDTIGKHLKVPLYKLLGGYRDKVPIIGIGGYYVAGKDDRQLTMEIQSYQEQGLAGVKMKVGRLGPEEDARRVRIVRKAVGDAFVIVCDANQAWTPEDAIDFAHRVEDLNLRWLEEPVRWYDPLLGYRRVRQHCNIPIAVGQGEITRFGCRDLILNEAVDIINVDATIAGGVTEWRRIAALAGAFGVEMAHHEEPQIAIHLLASIPHGLYVEIFPDPERDPMWFELPVKLPEIKNGCMLVPQEPGVGIELKTEVIQQYSPTLTSVPPGG